MTFLTALQDAQTVVVIGTAVTGSVVAVLGLKAWKQQLVGRSEYDLARRFLRAAFRLRDEVSFARAPFISVGEMQAAATEAGVDPDKATSMHSDEGMRLARWARLRRVSTAASDLRVEQIEAEVLWGSEVENWVNELNKSVQGLFSANREFDMWGERPPKRGELRQVELRKVMFGSGGDQDAFWSDLIRGLGGLERKLRGYLAAK